MTASLLGKPYPARVFFTEEAREVARKSLIVLAALSGLIIACGCSLNSLGLKYIRVSGSGFSGESKSNSLGCEREVLVLSMEKSNFCCDGIRASDWVCVAAYDHMNRLFTSQPWAYLLPLLPLFLTTIFVERSSVKRVPFYAVLFAHRLVVLYWGLDYVQSRLQVNDMQESNCWYAKFRRKGDCIDHFDFSDHIVFYVAQLLIPCAIEFGYAVHVAVANTKTRKMWLRILPTVLACLVLVYLSLRAILFTSIYFHTTRENVTGFLLVVGLAVWPVSYSL